MGRYAQQRKRGSNNGLPLVGSLMPPPAPAFDDEDGHYVQSTNGVGSPGGSLVLETQDVGGGEWSVYSTVAYQNPYEWGVFGEWEDLWVRVREIGVGANYLGTSDPSEQLPGS